MSVIYIDTEFYEDGRTIEAISLGAVRDDGAELYVEFANFPWHIVPEGHFVQKHVRPLLESENVTGEYADCVGQGKLWSRAAARHLLEGFAGPRPDFWAWYGAYDWVLVAQLFGTMTELPRGWPMYCNDLRQLVTPHTVLPPKPDAAHNALADARWLRDAHRQVLSQVSA